MILNPIHAEWMKRFAPTPDGAILREVLAAYILEVKDDCVEKRISQDAAQAVISKLKELSNKMDVASGTAPSTPLRDKFL